jgi:hypothetical protein
MLILLLTSPAAGPFGCFFTARVLRAFGKEQGTDGPSRVKRQTKSGKNSDDELI